MNLSAHHEKFPADIAEYFCSSWDTRKLWRLETPRRQLQIEDLKWHLAYPFCSSNPPAPLFDLTPHAVLENPHQFSQHWRRVVDADLSFPVDVSHFGERWVILDGIHRLLKCISGGIIAVECKFVPREYLRVAA